MDDSNVVPFPSGKDGVAPEDLADFNIMIDVLKLAVERATLGEITGVVVVLANLDGTANVDFGLY